MNVNTYIVSDEISHEGLIIDCACSDEEEQSRLADYLSAESINLTAAFNTHLHFDHIFGNQWLNSTYGLKPMASQMDEDVLDWNKSISLLLPISTQAKMSLKFNDYLWIEQQSLPVGQHSFDVIHSPGHSPGSTCLYCKEKHILFDGDVIFKGALGRTDLWGGDGKMMKISVDRLLTLPGNTIVFPGHGPQTTIQNEK